MIHEAFREDILESADVMPAKKRIIQSADHIIAISEHTKKDIIKYLDIPEEKISVVYHGGAVTHGELKPLSLPTTYVLFVGSRSGYKSFDKFIRFSCEALIKNNVSVFCAGGGPFTSTEKLLIQQLGLSNLLFQKNVTDEELNYCYKHARLFIFPSIYEGFGLPILEAFACHCPVLLFNGSCFPEIARDSAYYFDNFEDLPELLSKMLIDDVFRNKKIQMQNLRLLDFSWSKTAQQTSSVYKNIL
ncbi:D-inositol 3-phosphate glycosyltransferase [compost metagenome]